jgi:hypothetical protein
MASLKLSRSLAIAAVAAGVLALIALIISTVQTDSVNFGLLAVVLIIVIGAGSRLRKNLRSMAADG